MGRVGLIAAGIFLLGWSSTVRAQETVTLEGLTLPCGGCSVERSGSECVVSLDHGSTTSRCSTAAYKLLEARRESGYDGTNPTVAELRKFLMRADMTDEQAYLPLSLLVEIPSGENAIKLDASSYVSQFPNAIAKLVEEGKGSTELHELIWKLPQSEGVTLDTRLRATLLAKSPTLSVDTVVADLTVVESQKDADDLKMYAEALRPMRPEWSIQLERLEQFIRVCETQFQSGTGDKECTRDAIKDLPDSFKRYGERLRIRATLHGIKTSRPTAIEKFSRLARLDYIDHSTPELFVAVSDLLTEAAKSDITTKTTLLDARGKKMFRAFARNDTVIGRLYAELLVSVAVERWRAGDDETTLEMVEESIQSYPLELSARRDLLFDFRSVKDLTRFPGTQAAVRQLTAPTGTAIENIVTSSGPSSDKKKLMLVAIAGLLGIVALGLYFRLQLERIKREQQEIEAALRYRSELAREDGELTNLLKFFGFSVKPDEVELVKAFRKMAKERHPDAEGGSHELFNELQRNYDRLEELLTKESHDQPIPPTPDEA